MSETQALEVVPVAGHKRAWDLMPTTQGEAMELAKLIADSDLAPRDYKGKPANVLIAVQMGADVGLRPMQSVQNIAIINGRPSVWGDAALALVLSSNLLVSIKEWEDGGFVAHCLLQRKGGEPVERTFGPEDAKTAGLYGKPGPWTNYPKRMRQMRARGFALRDVFADVLMGLSIVEDIIDVGDETGTTRETIADFHLEPADSERLDKAFEALSLSPARRLVFQKKHLTRADRPMTENVDALLEDLRDEYSKRKTGAPRKLKEAPVAEVVEGAIETASAEMAEDAKAEKEFPVTAQIADEIAAERVAEEVPAEKPKATKKTGGKFQF